QSGSRRLRRGEREAQATSRSAVAPATTALQAIASRFRESVLKNEPERSAKITAGAIEVASQTSAATPRAAARGGPERNGRAGFDGAIIGTRRSDQASATASVISGRAAAAAEAVRNALISS